MSVEKADCVAATQILIPGTSLHLWAPANLLVRLHTCFSNVLF